MFTLKKTFSILSMAALLFVGCTPEDGDIGPVGPIGPAGQNGINGQNGIDGQDGNDGQDGSDGQNGSANVQSNNQTVLITDWTPGLVLRDTLAVPALSQAVVDSGMVLIYLRSTTNATWDLMPFSFVAFLAGQPATLTFQAGYNVGEVYLSASNSLNANITPNAVFPGDRDFKIVVVPAASKIDGLNLNNFEVVKAVYGFE